MPELSSIKYIFDKKDSLIEGMNFELHKNSVVSIDDDLFDESEKVSKNFFNFKNLRSSEKILKFNNNDERLNSSDMKTFSKRASEYQIGYRVMASGVTTFLPNRINDKSTDKSIVAGPTSILNTGAVAYSSLMNRIRYIGPVRLKPQRFYQSSYSFSGSIGNHGEMLADALKSDQNKSGGIKDELNKWLERLNVNYYIDVSDAGDEVSGDLTKVTIFDKKNNIPLAPTDVGYGISQIMPILIEGVISRKALPKGRERIICIEQPEIHLHPKLQADFTDFFIETALGESCQWILETHSESFMLRIQRRIREGVIKSGDVSVIFVDPDCEGGSRIINIRLDEKGNFLDEWPGGFFEERFMETFA